MGARLHRLPVLHHQDSGGKLHRAQAVGDDDGSGHVQDKQVMAPEKALAMARRCHCPPERSAPFSFIFPRSLRSQGQLVDYLVKASICRDGRMMECASVIGFFSLTWPE